jgi:hypothetical protein
MSAAERDKPYLLAFLSIISEMDEVDFQMGKTRSCVRLRETSLSDTLMGLE